MPEIWCSCAINDVGIAGKQAQEYLDDIGAKWEEVEEKPAVIAISVASFIAIWAASGIIVRPLPSTELASLRIRFQCSEVLQHADLRNAKSLLK